MSDDIIVKAKQFLKKLSAAGVEVIPSRGKGGHYRLVLADRWSTLSFQGAKDLRPEYMNDICKQLGLRMEDVI